MTASQGMDSGDLWRRVGLEELRRELAQVSNLIKDFQCAIESLPPCDQCARVALLEQIHSTGKALGHQAISLTVLAESLEGVVATAERTQAELAANAPEPCKCAAGPCVCHA